MDWHAWHSDYDRAGSRLAQRLVMVQAQIRTVLDRAPQGPVSVISVCAGQGRDLIGVLADHPRRDEVRAVLVELEPTNTEYAAKLAASAGLDGVEVVTGDAADLDHYAEYAPAQLVLLCGLFGNIVDADIERTIGYCEQLCATGGTVVWTRGRRTKRDRFPLICEWFEEHGFERRWTSPPEVGFGVGAHLRTAPPSPLAQGESMFTFVGYDILNEGAGKA